MDLGIRISIIIIDYITLVPTLRDLYIRYYYTAPGWFCVHGPTGSYT